MRNYSSSVYLFNVCALRLKVSYTTLTLVLDRCQMTYLQYNRVEGGYVIIFPFRYISKWYQLHAVLFKKDHSEI